MNTESLVSPAEILPDDIETIRILHLPNQNAHRKSKQRNADIKTAVRASRTGKDRVFLEQALAPCGSINVARLAQAAIEGVDSIGSYLETTAYADAVEELRRSPSAFERWCDNLLIRKIKPQQYSAFGLGPLAAYILARENEIKSVRIVLSGKLNHLPEESIRERIREMYV